MSSPRLRRSPPRRPLHERSESQTNGREPSTLCNVDESQNPEYASNPYPTKPSQVLLPSRQYPTNPISKDAPYEQVPLDTTAVLPRGADPIKESRADGSRQNRYAEAALKRSSTNLSFYTASARESTAFATPNLERNESSSMSNQPGALIRQVTEDPDLTTNPDAEPHNESTQPGTPTERQPSNKDSDNSLSSTNTTGTVIVKKARDGKKRASYSAFPYSARPSSSRSNISTPTSQRSSPKIPEEQPASQSSGSPIALEGPTFPPKERRISSAPAPSDPSNQEGVLPRLQYPVIRPPSASGSWAESSTLAPPVPTRAIERAQQRWNPHLSTVQSERTDSMSAERSSQGVWMPGSSRTSHYSSKILSIRMSSEQPTVPSRSSMDLDQLSRGPVSLSPVPSLPSSIRNPLPIRQGDFTEPTVRAVDVQTEDVGLYAPSTSHGSRDPNQARTVGSRDRRTETVTRPSSRASFFRESIPAWAKSYYARPTSSSSVSDQRDSVATDNISLNVWRPRNRNQQMPPKPDRRRSGLAMHPTRPDELVLTDTRNMSRRWSPILSPHLWHDRASPGRRRSLFKAPSVDEAAEGNALTKRNAQILCFALGFVLPLCWFIAAFLPLPSKPAFSSAKGKNVPRASAIALDLEKRIDPTDVARYENARWWRNINRIMCLAGTAIIILLIALAATAAT